ncbi:MAG TPA: hypothetical protein VIO86_12675 [Candidatus Dormibacteraeota bacterium]
MYEDANRAIWNAYERAARRQADLKRFPSLIRAIDDLLFELEELNLSGIDRVPAMLRDRTSHVLSLVPVDDPEEIRVRYRVGALMDTLFKAQEVVFRAKDPGRPPLQGEDGEERTA